jgi:hypothetical protein
LRNVHLGDHVPVVPLRPTAHGAERGNECPPQLGQGIFDGDGLDSVTRLDTRPLVSS